MDSTWAATGVTWGIILISMAVFFAGVARRLPGRGLEFLALAMGSAGLAEFMSAGAVTVQSGTGALLLARASVMSGSFTLSLNLHFLLRFGELKGLRPLPWISYVVAGATAVAMAMLTFAQISEHPYLESSVDYFSPSTAYTYVLLGAFVLNYGASIYVALRAYRHGRRHALVVLLALSVIAPTAILDTAVALIDGDRWFLAEVGAWAYCLAVLVSLLSEFQGTEGRLKETKSSLAERTAELEITYAEIDLMSSELLSKQQLAAVGELAGSIAHEVRNPLAIIMNAVSGLRRHHISQNDRDTLLSIVNEEAERLNHLVTELLRFARPVAASRGPASLYDICQKASDEVPETFTVRIRRDEVEINPVHVDPGLLRLALDNLIANAAQAMDEHGTVELTVRNGAFSDGTPAAAIDIKDSGCGMSPDEQERAKKPFFTTKPRGTGLGIPIAIRIVEAHGGELQIDSEPHLGTTVTIRLPFEPEGSSQPAYPGSKSPSTRRRRRSFSATSLLPTDDTKKDEPLS